MIPYLSSDTKHRLTSKPIERKQFPPKPPNLKLSKPAYERLKSASEKQPVIAPKASPPLGDPALDNAPL